jgi:hypothetical protein
MAPAPRDIYEKDVDFVALAEQDPAFAKKYLTALVDADRQLLICSPD